jgi:hypothetical protein
MFTTLYLGLRAYADNFGFGQKRLVEEEIMSDWDNLGNGMVSRPFVPPNEITVLFDDRTRTFLMSAATTLADVAQRLAEEGGPQRSQMLSVTIKLGGAPGFSTPLSVASNAMTARQSGAGLASRTVKRRAAQRALVMVVAVLLPWLAMAVLVPHFL